MKNADLFRQALGPDYDNTADAPTREHDTILPQWERVTTDTPQDCGLCAFAILPGEEHLKRTRRLEIFNEWVTDRRHHACHTAAQRRATLDETWDRG